VCTTTTPEAVIADADPLGHSWILETDAGTLVYEVYQEGDYLVVKSNAGADRIAAGEDGTYRFTVDGSEFEWESTTDGDLTVVAVDFTELAELTTVPSVAPASPQPSPVPVVTCVTPTPDASESASPMPTVSTSALPEASPADPDLTWTWNPDDPLNNPFQCGFVFPATEEGSPDFRVEGDLTTDTEIRATFSEWYGNQAPTTEVGDTGAPAYHASVDYDATGFAAGVVDPALVTESENAFGIGFVAVRDGVVVGTISPESDGTTYGMIQDRDGVAGPAEAFLWDPAAFAACGSESLDGVQIYAVAGLGGEVGGAYSWSRITE
jgi:hypothetical protein